MALNWFVIAALLAGFAVFGRPRRLATWTPREGSSGRGHGCAAADLSIVPYRNEPDLVGVQDAARGPDDRPGVDRGPARQASVVVVIPARNEERNLPRLLDSLPAASVLPLRIVVVDDHSVDGTAACAVERGFECIRSAPLPPGWLGKPWACQQGLDLLTDAPDDTVVVLLDADVMAGVGAVDHLIRERARHGGVVSVQPTHEVPTAVEQLSAVFNVVAVIGIGAGTGRPNGLFGPVLAATVADLRAVGGYVAVRDEVAEDLALAERFRRHGVPLQVRVGGAFRFRMYPEGWTALREGWTKNIASGARAVPWWRTLLVGWWVTGLLVAVRDLSTAVITGTGRDAALIGYGLAAASLALLFRRVGTYRGVTALFYPLPLAAFVGLFAVSAWSTFVQGAVRWKGRVVPTSRVGGRSPADRMEP